jgi:amino acid transporter
VLALTRLANAYYRLASQFKVTHVEALMIHEAGVGRPYAQSAPNEKRGTAMATQFEEAFDRREQAGADVALSGRMGVVELIFTTLALAAPVAVVSGFIPFVMVFDGVAAPAVYLVVTLLLLVFAVGYTAMSRYLPNGGAFYAYVTAGLGKVPGLGSAFVAMYAYTLLALATYAFLGIGATALVHDTFNGPEIPWYWFSFATWGVAGLLGYRRIDLSAKVLTVAMGLEILIVMVFNIAVAARGGPEPVSFTPFSIGEYASGSVGIATLFGVACFLGFEATAVYRTEVKNPDRTIPRATYGAVLLIGVFYALAAWMIVTAYGVSKAAAVATADPTGMFTTVMMQYVGSWGVSVVSVLLVSSLFAAAVACQNILARYCFALGADGVLPTQLGAVHKRHGSPHIASVSVTAVTGAVLLSVVLMRADPVWLYSRLSGAGAFALLLLMLLTSLAVIAFFRRTADARASVWHSLIAPSLAAAGMAAIVYLAISQFGTLIGGSTRDVWIFQAFTWGSLLGGAVLALVYRGKRRDVYDRIGRQAL